MVQTMMYLLMTGMAATAVRAGLGETQGEIITVTVSPYLPVHGLVDDLEKGIIWNDSETDELE
jgi:hypothetical protein